MNKTKIEWTDYSWNPVIGCKHDCWYCYGRKLAKRFFKDNPNYEPRFHPERLREPDKVEAPSKIFVCSMADLFGRWVPDEWIKRVIKTTERNPHHIFQFLTKNPGRYLEFKFPMNCWLGVTITGKEKCKTEAKFSWLHKKDNYKFISFEPLMDKPPCFDSTEVDLVIVGAMTGWNRKNIIPKKEWIDAIVHNNIFYKDNIKKYLNQN